MGSDARTAGIASGTARDRRPTTPWRGLIHTVVIVVSLFPGLALAPVYQWFAPVVLPMQWVAAAIGGRVMKVIYSLLATAGTFMTVAFVQWSFTRCANHGVGLGNRARRRNRRGRDAHPVIQGRLEALWLPPLLRDASSGLRRVGHRAACLQSVYKQLLITGMSQAVRGLRRNP